MDTTENKCLESPAGVKSLQGAKNLQRGYNTKFQTTRGDAGVTKPFSAKGKEPKTSTGTQLSDFWEKRFQEAFDRKYGKQIPRVSSIKTSPKRNSRGNTS